MKTIFAITLKYKVLEPVTHHFLYSGREIIDKFFTDKLAAQKYLEKHYSGTSNAVDYEVLEYEIIDENES